MTLKVDNLSPPVVQRIERGLAEPEIGVRFLAGGLSKKMNEKLNLSAPVSKLKGVGPRYLSYLEKLGILTIKDLLWYFPFRYEDFSKIKKIEELTENETVSILATH